MPSACLPPQADWPEHVFRVTSTLTFRRTLLRSESQYSFTSPVEQHLKRRTSLSDAFQTDVQFKDAVVRHLKTSRVIESGGTFYSPFISTTTSLRYAFSVAELHYQREGQDITIAVIDRKLLEKRRPIWDAEEVADLIHLDRSPGDFKNEYLVFGSIEASEKTLQAVKYVALTSKIGGFIPAFLERDNTQRARFSTFWRGIPKRKNPFTPFEIFSALQIARSMATNRLIIPLMVMVLLLEERRTYGSTCIDEVVEIVRAHMHEDDYNAYFPFILNASYDQSTTGASSQCVNVYDFLDEQYHPRQESAAGEVKYVYQCLESLRRQLHDDQAVKIAKRFNLTATALVVRQYTRGHADKVVKSNDRWSEDLGAVLIQFKGSLELVKAYRLLRREVEQCKAKPLSHLNRLLQKVKSSAPRDEASSLINDDDMC